MQFGASTFIWVSPFSNKTLGLVKKVREMGFDIIEICIEDPATIEVSRINGTTSWRRGPSLSFPFGSGPLQRSDTWCGV
jgi:hypothetical protein